MNTIYLKEFIKTGQFGTITIGSTKSELVSTLGEKFDFLDCGDTQIIKYGWYEFFCWKETELIFGIQNDHLQADCTNHKEMIDYKNKLWTIDKWFLQTNTNITFGQIEELLTQEDVSFSTTPEDKDYGENVIKCLKSNVTFDFVNKYTIVEYDEKGKFKTWKEYIENDQSNFVLNGIRLFDYQNNSICK